MVTNPSLLSTYLVFVFLLIGLVYSDHDDKKSHQSNTGSSRFHHRRATQVGVLSHLLEKYDKTLAPVHETGSPVTVSVNMHIIEIQLHPIKMELNVEIYLRLNWTDPRLKYAKTHGSGIIKFTDEHKKLWVPDIFFKNERSGHLHHLMTLNQFTQITPEGKVMMSTRITLNSACPMSFRWFPMDSPTCAIDMESYGNTAGEMTLVWSDMSPVTVAEPGVRFLTTDKYLLKDIQTTASAWPERDYVSLTVSVLFQRVLSFHIWHFFLPTTLMVAVSWVSFWLHSDLVTARMLLGLTTLLATLHYQVAPGLAPPSAIFITVFDVWGIICILLVTLSLLETAWVYYLNGRDGNRKDGKVYNALPCVPNTLIEPECSTTGTRQYSSSTQSNRLDSVARLAFPLTFVVLTIVFWVVLASI